MSIFEKHEEFEPVFSQARSEAASYGEGE